MTKKGQTGTCRGSEGTGALETTLDINSPSSSSQTACPMAGGARDEFWPLKREQPGQDQLSADRGAEKVTRSGRGSPQVAREKLLGQRSRRMRSPRETAMRQWRGPDKLDPSNVSCSSCW